MPIIYSVWQTINSTCRISILSLLFVIGALQPCEAMKGGQKKKIKSVQQVMTVVTVRQESPNETFFTVTFTPSQRFYKLPNDANPKYLILLKESEKNHTPVIITRASERSDVILSVSKKH